MTTRWLFIVCAIFFVTAPLGAAPTRDDLLFGLNAALKTRDKAALARCFYLGGTDAALRRATERIVDEILAWPTHHVFTTERTETGKVTIPQDGRNFTLNGDWTYQIHIHVKPPPSTGYVFPAGTAPDGRAFILLTVPEKE